jgi:hypothetical protein
MICCVMQAALVDVEDLKIVHQHDIIKCAKAAALQRIQVSFLFGPCVYVGLDAVQVILVLTGYDCDSVAKMMGYALESAVQL